MADRNVHFFGGGGADGGRALRDLLGGKGANLAEMAKLGLPVPPGFTISTEVCAAFSSSGSIPEPVRAEISQAVSRLEEVTGASLGDGSPLLLSVRSGARVSMPGMMDTVLNLGLDDETVESLARATGDRRFALDCYRRFCAMYGSVVLGLGDEPFDALLEQLKRERHAASDSELNAADLAKLVADSKALILERTGTALPGDPRDQLTGAIEAVFRSWNNPRAVTYRQANAIPAQWGTAVTVQAMVFGNRGDSSATGVAFTRDPSTGMPGLAGEFLSGAQGEDVVAGVRTPLAIDALRRWNAQVYRELEEGCARLEGHFADVQDVEFTVERGKLWFLQCRSAKRTAAAAVRIAVDLAQEGLIGKEEAIRRVEPSSIEQLQRPRFDPGAVEEARAQGRLLGTGLAAGPGAACGKLAVTPAAAERMAAAGEVVVLARAQTSPEDIRGLIAAAALLTSTGGMSSHAALVARQMGKVAVVGCAAMKVDADAISFGARTLREGEVVSVDGASAEIWSGPIAMTSAGAPEGHLETLLSWADSFRRLGVRANADDAEQARAARALGAQGIGLCRTEHMFFGLGKIEPMREMILARTPEERAAALDKLLPIQRRDFAALFREMAGLPVTIRLLDPPLHEFVPHDEEGIARLATAAGIPVGEVRRRAAELFETNPMLGLRGCRLGITHPEITSMQARAVFEAACDVALEKIEVHPQLMVPLVGDAHEFRHQARLIHAAADAVFLDRDLRVPYRVGTMIEVPRAAITAGDIAETADFFSFGTNDLTQMTYGLSRDDVGPVLRQYLDIGVYRFDPFVTLDREGVGELMRLAVVRGREVHSRLEIGVCGEHGGDPDSISFCHELGLDYISCSPLRVPVARLAAARAALGRADQELTK